MTEKLIRQLEFLAEVDKMKSIYRKTLLIDKSRTETDAEHSWHFALMAITLFEYVGVEGVDINRVVKMALIHDLVEVYAGDTYAYDDAENDDRLLREQAAAKRLFSKLPQTQGEEFSLLWEEFDAMKTPDAMYATAIDRLQPLLNQYKTDGQMWIENKIRKEQVLVRMQPIKAAIPALWEFVEFVIDDACKKGRLN